MKTKRTNLLILMLLSLFTGTTQAQISNTRVELASSWEVIVTYDLAACGLADVTLYYSPDKCDWHEAISVTGDLENLSAGTDYQIVWNSFEDNVLSAKYYFKVEATIIPKPCLGVEINCVCWAKTNLDVGGVFAANDYDYGALYQWGRQADGHESRTSTRYPTNNTSSESGVVSGADLDGITGQVATTSGAYGKFIKNNSYATLCDWRIPQDDKLWNSGTETKPSKNTAADPCPAGWRVPTQAELAKLTTTAVTSTWTTNYKGSSIRGCLVTDNATSASIFLPAAGNRFCSDGSLTDVGSNGFYWSSSHYHEAATYKLYLGGPFFDATGIGNRGTGNSVRCVAE